jgi:hypothetical protein
MTRTSWERIDVLFRFLVTGLKALLFGLALWYLLLAVSVFVSAVDSSRHIHRHWYWPFYLFRSDWGLGLVYGGVFFFAAMLASRSRRSCCPALAAFIAYALFVVIALPRSDVFRIRLLGVSFHHCSPSPRPLVAGLVRTIFSTIASLTADGSLKPITNAKPACLASFQI